jgi:hypothetical protein
MTPVISKEIAEEIKLNLKKAPDDDLITGQILKQLSRKGIALLLMNLTKTNRYISTLLRKD